MTCYWESEYREIAGRVWKAGWFTCCCNPRREKNRDFKFYMCRVDRKTVQSKEECWDYLEEYINIGGLFEYEEEDPILDIKRKTEPMGKNAT